MAEQKLTQSSGEAYSKAASSDTAVNGFKKSGIWPINPNAIAEEEFAPSDVTEKPQSDATSATENCDVQSSVVLSSDLPTVEIETSTVTHAVVESAEDI